MVLPRSGLLARRLLQVASPSTRSAAVIRCRRGASATSSALADRVSGCSSASSPSSSSTASFASSAIESVDLPFVPALGLKTPKPVPKELRDLKLGFIGWGAMAQAVSLGLLRKDLTSPEQVMTTDVLPQVLNAARAAGLQTADNNQTLVDWADIVIMAVKPQGVDPVIEDIAPRWRREQVLVSICAGVTINTYEHGLGTFQRPDGAMPDGAKVVRVMPNTPCLVGEAATAYAGSDACTEAELDLVHKMFAAVGGATHRVPEYLLNTVTGLSGSGPAYVYMLIQALSDAGVHGGLPRNVALSLAAQTVAGAARMVQNSGQHPMLLKEAVTSPAGTTIAGVRVLEQKGFNSAVIEAVEAARARSETLSRTPDFLHKK